MFCWVLEGVMVISSQLNLFGNFVDQRELPCPSLHPFPWDSMYPRYRDMKTSPPYFKIDNSEYLSQFQKLPVRSSEASAVTAP